VLEDVTLAVAEGESLALIGHNGAGKTTLMKLVLGLTRPSAGSVLVHGLDPAAARSRKLRRTLGYLPETVAFEGGLSGRDVLRLYADLKRVGRPEVETLLTDLGLEAAAGRPVRTYSKGMRQRLGLAQAMLGEPGLLVLDEPTTGLDPSLRREFFEIVSRLRARGATVILSSHALGEIAPHADRIAILRYGRLAALGTLAELTERAGLRERVTVLVKPGSGAEVAEGLSGRFEIGRVNGQRVELYCQAVDKLSLLREVADPRTPVRDLEILSPSLDDVYAHFVDRGEEP
jgi:Cu-processing system ATP-binding protein